MGSLDGQECGLESKTKPIAVINTPIEEPANCLLTEFPNGKVKNFLACWKSVVILPLLGVAGVGIVLLLGHLGNTNGLAITITPILQTDNGQTISPTPVTHVYGYLAELSHALFFLLLFPMFIITAFWFIQDADGAIRKLNAQGRMEKPANGDSPISYVGEKNKRRFRLVPAVLILIFLAVNVFFETLSYRSVSQGKTFEVGYIQAPFLQTWQTHFNSTTEAEKFALIKNFKIYDQLEQQIKATVMDKRLMLTNWYGCIAVSNLNNPSPETISKVLSTGDFTLSLDKARETNLLTLSASTQGGPNPGSKLQMTAFHAFAVTLIIYEACMHAFMAWVALKIIFWLVRIYEFLPGGRKSAFELEPLIADPVNRYGLYELHPPYNHIVHLLLIGAIGFSLNYVSNAAKGTFVYQHSGTDAFLGQLLIQTVIFVVAIFIVIFPMLLFGFRLGKKQKKRLADLDDLIAESNHQHDTDKAQKLESEKDVVRKQTTWPWKDSGFRTLGAAFVAFVALPWFSMAQIIPDSFKQYVSVLNWAKWAMTHLTAYIYHIKLF